MALTEGEIGIVLGLLALLGSGAIMIWPTHLWIGWTMIAMAIVGLLLLGLQHFALWNLKTPPAIGIVLFGTLFLVSIVWYFWPAESSASNGFLSLYEAARRLIDENIGVYDTAARKLSISDEGPITWWCYWVKGKTKIYGKFIPARVLRELPDISYDFKVEGENIVAVQRSGRDKWEEISILTSEFPRLLRQAKESAGLRRRGEI